MAQNKGYGFLGKLPDTVKPRTQADTNPQSGDDAWCTTAMIAGAFNHCAAVMAANMLLCLEKIPESDRRRIAKESYALIGPGPVFRGGRSAERFLASKGLCVRTRPVLTVGSAMHAIEHMEPCALLVHGKGIRDWHWITAFGFVRTADGRIFLRAADGWSSRPMYFLNGAGSRLVFGTSFRTLEDGARKSR